MFDSVICEYDTIATCDVSWCEWIMNRLCRVWLSIVLIDRVDTKQLGLRGKDTSWLMCCRGDSGCLM